MRGSAGSAFGAVPEDEQRPRMRWPAARHNRLILSGIDGFTMGVSTPAPSYREGGRPVTDHVHARHRGGKERSTAILDVSGLRWASEQNVVAARLGRCPGVLEVEVNPVAQTATVLFDPARTSLAELRAKVIECGYHCAGQSVPAHICDPMDEPDPPPADHEERATDLPVRHDGADRRPRPPSTTPRRRGRPARHDGPRRSRGTAFPARHDGPRWACRDVDGRDGRPTCATGSWWRCCSRSRS